MSSLITLQLELAPIHERVGCNGDGFEFGTVGNSECVVGGNGRNGGTHGETPLANHNTLQLLHPIDGEGGHVPTALRADGYGAEAVEGREVEGSEVAFVAAVLDRQARNGLQQILVFLAANHSSLAAAYPRLFRNMQRVFDLPHIIELYRACLVQKLLHRRVRFQQARI